MMQPGLPQQQSRWWWKILVLALPAVFLYANFSQVFECPECYLFEDTGDGLKNYYTLAYYVEHDSGWHFSGMNYPYGEHIIYTDNQPVLARVLQWVDRHVVDLHGHVVGALNILLLLGLYAGIVLTYALLRRWRVGRGWALTAAACIILLSPQLWRLHGHYGLAYLCFFPGFVLLLDHAVRGPGRPWRWALLTGVAVILMSLTHMYFLLLCGFTGLAWLFFYGYYKRREYGAIRSLLPAGLLGILMPAIVLIAIRAATDRVPDRPAAPWGLDAHLVTAETTFFPFFPPFDKTWTTLLKRDRPINERVAYISLPGLLLLPALLFFLFRRRRDDADDVDLFLKAGMATAVACWLMAAGVFYQNGFRWLWELIPPLKQFRGLGRFGVPFCYLYMAVMSWLLWQWYRQFQLRDLARPATYLLSAVALVWGFEAWHSFREVRAPMFHPNKWMSVKPDDYIPILQQAGYAPSDFQAILQLPVVAIGNETMGVARGFWTFREAIHASMETGLPQIGYAMSRTSVSQGLDLVELIGPPYLPKRRAAKLTDQPILLLCEEEFMLPEERYWIEQATRIGAYQSITLYHLPVEAFRILSPPPDSLWGDAPCAGWSEDFEAFPSDTAMTGRGAMVVRESPKLVWTMVDTAAGDRPFEVSFWAYIDRFDSAMPVPRMKETAPDGQIIANTGLHREKIAWMAAAGDWIEVRFPVTFRGGGHRYELFIDNTGPVIDRLLIRPSGDTCTQILHDQYFFNNRPVSRK